MYAFCEECGAQNPADGVFCDSCGWKLETDAANAVPTVACPDCTAANIRTARYCEECGTPIPLEARPGGRAIVFVREAAARGAQGGFLAAGGAQLGMQSTPSASAADGPPMASAPDDGGAWVDQFTGGQSGGGNAQVQAAQPPAGAEPSAFAGQSTAGTPDPGATQLSQAPSTGIDPGATQLAQSPAAAPAPTQLAQQGTPPPDPVVTQASTNRFAPRSGQPSTTSTTSPVSPAAPPAPPPAPGGGGFGVGSFFRIAGITVAGVAGLSVIAAIILGVLLFTGSPSPCVDREVVASSRAEQAMRDRWVEFVAKAETGRASVTFTEVELTSRAVTYVEEKDLPVKKITIYACPDGLGEALMTVDATIGTFDVLLRGNLDLSGDVPVIRVDSVDAGNVPGFIAKPIVDQILDRGGARKPDLDVELDSVRVDDGSVTIKSE